VPGKAIGVLATANISPVRVVLEYGADEWVTSGNAIHFDIADVAGYCAGEIKNLVPDRFRYGSDRYRSRLAWSVSKGVTFGNPERRLFRQRCRAPRIIRCYVKFAVPPPGFNAAILRDASQNQP
jgi:hypothetical protein